MSRRGMRRADFSFFGDQIQPSRSIRSQRARSSDRCTSALIARHCCARGCNPARSMLRARDETDE